MLIHSSSLPIASLPKDRPSNSNANCMHYSKEDKTHINIVVIGHVDSGKSTTTGKATPSPD